jgi:hypothetical protein
MSDKPTLVTSFDSVGEVNPEKDSANALRDQAEKTPDEQRSWWKRTKNRLNRIFPRVTSPSEDRLTNPLPGIILFLFLLGIAALSILLMRAPAPLPESAPADQFSAARAMAHVEALATQPRPIGSAAHAEARDYLVSQLEGLGLETQVQKAVAVSGEGPWSGTVANVENVLGRLPGSRTGGKAVLLMAHYDSVMTGPGAKDDGSGVAVLLETARALTAGSQSLMNDVILLFTDGEEQTDFFGARVFIEQHPWAKGVGLVLNFDAGDNTGPAYMAQTGPSNSWMIAEYAQVAPDPLASSLAPEIVGHMPTASDFDVFRHAGYPGLTFGSIGKSGYYHTALDNLADVDLGALQHQGSQAVALAQRFGSLDLAASHDGDAIYFNLVGTHLLVHYPRVWVFPLVVLAALLYAGALVFGLRWKQATLRGILLGLLASLFVAVILGAVGYLIWRLILVAYPQYDPVHFEIGANTYNSWYYWLAFAALGVGLAALLHGGLRSRVRAVDLALGALLLWLVIAIGFSVALPGASYIVAWPVLFGGVGLCGWFLLARRSTTRPWRMVWLALFTVPAVLLFVPFIYAGGMALSIQKIWVAMAALGLLLGLVTLPLEIMAQPRRSWLPALMGLALVGFLIGGHLTSDYSPTRPLRDHVFYALSADTGKAYWLGHLVGEDGLDVYTEQFLGKNPLGGDLRDLNPWITLQGYKVTAPMADLPVPSAELLEAKTGVFRLHVTATPGTYRVAVYFMPDPAPDVTFYIDGKPIKSEGYLEYCAPPGEGFDLTVEAPGQTSLTLRVVDVVSGLPALPGFSYTPRPDWIMADTSGGDGKSVVAKTFTFEKE